jgi:hypothetical protein
VSNVVQVDLFLNKPDRSQTFVIDNLRALGTYDPSAEKVPGPFFPLYGDVARLNAAWESSYASWDALLGTKAASVKQVLKEVAPNKLYLGCRFADYNATVVKVAADYRDVVSFNLYRDTVAAWRPPAEIDRPVIIGEFHFGAKDRGVFGNGLVGVDTTADAK